MTFLIVIVVVLIYLTQGAGFFYFAMMDPAFKGLSLTLRIFSGLIWPVELLGCGYLTWRHSYEEIRKELGKR